MWWVTLIGLGKGEYETQVERENLKADNHRLEHELTLRQIELKQVSARVAQSGLHVDSVPRFDECELDSLFSSFERIARNLDCKRK